MRLHQLAAAALFVALFGGAEQSRARHVVDGHPPGQALPRTQAAYDALGIAPQLVSCSGPGTRNALVWDGDSFEYESYNFSASVRLDGAVDFRDHPAAPAARGDFVALTHEPMGGATRDPLERERDCFMAQTQKLRQALVRAHTR